MSESKSSSAWAAAAALIALLAVMGVGMVSCSNTPCQGATPKSITTFADGRTEAVC